MQPDTELTVQTITKADLERITVEQQARIDKATTRIVLKHTFFAAMLLNLRREPALWCPTMCTDGVAIYWNPVFTATLKGDEIAGVLVHEVLHCALGHLWRKRPEWDHQLSNVAADYAINNYLDTYNREADSQLSLPDGGLIDHQYDGMSFEQIYAALQKQAQQQKKKGGGDGDGDGKGPSCGEFIEPGQKRDDGEGGGGRDRTVTEAEWANIREKARQAAVAQGKMPAGLDRLLGNANKPEVDWLQQLSRFLDQVDRNDYDWQVPDRRFLPGVYVPGLHSETCGPIAVIFDTSGSVDDALLQRFAGELQDILGRVRPESVTVIYCDAAVANTEEFRPGDQLTLHPAGGGGTDFRPAYDWITEHLPHTVAAIYFTDGYGSFPTAPPDYPVMWVDYGGGAQYPWGEVIKVNL